MTDQDISTVSIGNPYPKPSEKVEALFAEVERLGSIVAQNLPKQSDDSSHSILNATETRHQTDQIREDQVMNKAGGYVFKVSDETQILRFLILGTAGNTYYTTEKELTAENLTELIKIIQKGNAHLILRLIYEVSISGRNPKQNALMLALALCSRYQVGMKKQADGPSKDYNDYLSAMHQGAFSIINEVCRIPTHLFAFVKNCEVVSKATGVDGLNKSTGWGRLMRSSICKWYYSQTPERLAMQVTKYKKREGYSHRDLFRLAHPLPKKHIMQEGQKLEVEQIYHYIVKDSLRTRKRRLSQEECAAEAPESKYSAIDMDYEKDSKVLDMIEAYLQLNEETSVEQVVHAIKTHNLVREHIPTNHLNSVPVWQALLDKMPMTALIRNLGKLSAIEALNDDWVNKVVNMLNDESQLKSAKIHPLNVLLAKSVYAMGRGEKGKLEWKTDPRVDQALESAFYKSFMNAPPTNKRICFAFDVSGSMTAHISGTHLSCRTASAALSLISLKNEKDVECVGFCDNLVELPYNKDWNLKQIEDHMDGLTFGSTDCALPMLWAMENNKKFDVFIVYTDSETFYGKVHPFEALRRYRAHSGIRDARLIVMGMLCTTHTIADPSDAGMLDISGFDSAVPQLLHEFVCGKL